MKESTRRREIREIQETTNFDNERIQLLRNEFQQINDGSGLTFLQFQKVFARAVPDYDQKSLNLNRMFDVFDSNQDGVVDFKELMSGLSIMYAGTLDEKLKFIFKAFDVGNKNYITLEEFTQLYKQVSSAFKFDYDLATFEEEFENTIRKDFKSLDKNNNGTLSFEEFKKIILIQPLIIECFSAGNSSQTPLVYKYSSHVRADPNRHNSFHFLPELTSKTEQPHKPEETTLQRCSVM